MNRIQFDPTMIKPYDVRFVPLTPPTEGVFDTPQIKLCVNTQWASHIDGVLGRLIEYDAWVGTDEVVNTAIQEVRKLLLALSQISEGCDVPAITDIRINGCNLEAQVDGVDEWIVYGDITDCAVPGPTGPTGPAGPTGPTGPTGPAGVDGANLFLRENAATGLEQDDNSGFTSPTLIAAYYLANQSRPATGFYGKATAPALHLHNASDVLKLQLGLATGGNELDTRESRLLIRYGSGSLNTRQIYLNEDGTIQFVNSVVTPIAKFGVYMDRSTENGMTLQGRTGLQDAFSVLDILSNNQSGAAGAQGVALKIRGVNDPTYTLAAGIYQIDRFGSVLQGDNWTMRALSTATPKVTRNAFNQHVTLQNESGSNYDSRVIQGAYHNGSFVETMRQESTSTGLAAWGVNGHAAQPTITLTGDIAGNEALANLVTVLDGHGVVVDGTHDDGLPDTETIPQFTRCQIASRAGLWMLDFYEYNVRAFVDALPLFGGADGFIEAVCLSFMPDPVALVDWLSLVDGIFNPGTAEELEAHLATVHSDVLLWQQAIYCALDENGCINTGFDTIFKVLLSSADFDTDLAIQFFDTFSNKGLSMMITNALLYGCDDDISCAGIDCDTWDVLFSVTSPDLDVVSGSVDGSGWSGCDGDTLAIELSGFHVYRLSFTAVTNVGDPIADPPSQIRAAPIGTSDWVYATPHTGANDVVLSFDAPTGIRLEVSYAGTAGQCVSIHTLRMQGLATAPSP